MSTAHRFPLGTTGWSVWRDAILRGTGFPAGGLTELAAPGAAAAADDLLRTGRSAELFEKQFAEAVRHGARRITELAGEPLFREAVTWQNPNMLATLDHLVREGAEVPRTSRRAQRERAVLRYWQRYCGKNETVGFYGPICWVRLDPTQPAAVVASPGPGLTRRRWVVLESWALQAYGTVLARDLAVRRWWPPVRWPHLRLAGHQVLRPGRPPLPLTPVEAALLAGCDGRRPAAEVVADPAAGVRRPEDGYLLLDRLVERGVITWDAALPVNPTAEQVLRERIAAIGDPTAQAGARAGLERLCAARDAVAAATGDPDRLRVALSTMDEVFTGLTGQPPRHRDGQMYAGRTLCYLDSSRDLEVVFGAPLLEEISAPLGVLLQAARWLSTALREAYTAALRQLYDELLADAQPVALADLWLLAQAAFWGSGPRPVDAVAVEFARRWAGLFGLDPVAQWHPGPGMPSREVRRRDGGAPAEVRLRVAEIADRVAEVFPAGRPDWSAGRLHSPDLAICATDADALARGEFTVVLGELHVAWATFDCEALVAGHPDRERLICALADDLGTRRLRLTYPTNWPRRTGRTGSGLIGPTDRLLAFAAVPGLDLDRTLSIMDCTVSEVDGELVATARDGQRWPLAEVFAELVGVHAADGFKLVAAAPYTPRITLDRLVVARRTWRTTVGETGLGEARGERQRYLAVRRFRHRLGLPERVYVKVQSETKPCFADLTSPSYASMLCSLLRAAQLRHGDQVPVVLTELLPGPDAAWLPDATGRRYFSELRLHITDPEEEM